MEITVNLANRSYPIILGESDISTFPELYRLRFGKRRCAIVTDANLSGIYPAAIAQWKRELGCTEISIPVGDDQKSIDNWQFILDELFYQRLDRKAVVIAFGGGVIGDISGFAAASYLRGVDFIQIPTTLLAMVDSSVGGKTGVNHKTGKNLIGAFWQPRLVWINLELLKTLPPREFFAGCGELFKYAFIGGRDMFDFVLANHRALCEADKAILISGIERSIRIKARIVEADEREESGQRALLNFGHTFAHAIEHYFGYGNVRHGEAVLWGIRCACALGKKIGTIASSDFLLFDSLLVALPQVKLPSIPDPQKLYAGMFGDKKTLDSNINFVLPTKPGESEIRNGIKKEDVIASMAEIIG